MADYQHMYNKLFNAVTDAISLLQRAQRETEEIYVSEDDTVVMIADPKDGKKG